MLYKNVSRAATTTMYTLITQAHIYFSFDYMYLQKNTENKKLLNNK